MLDPHPQPPQEDALPHGESAHSRNAPPALPVGAPVRTAPVGDRPGDDAPMRRVWEASVEAVVPEGRENAIPWSVVVERVQARLAVLLPERTFKPETVLRRCQEAAARLRRVKPPVNVIGLSGIGVFVTEDADDLRFQSGQRWRRIRRMIVEACRSDRISEAPILAPIEQLGLGLDAEAA